MDSNNRQKTFLAAVGWGTILMLTFVSEVTSAASSAFVSLSPNDLARVISPPCCPSILPFLGVPSSGAPTNVRRVSSTSRVIRSTWLSAVVDGDGAAAKDGDEKNRQEDFDISFPASVLKTFKRAASMGTAAATATTVQDANVESDVTAILDVPRIQKTLVKMGLEYKNQRKAQYQQFEDVDKNAQTGILVSPVLARVPGCMATVNVRAILVPIVDDDQPPQQEPQTYRVYLDGDADAMLSRGLLALLSQALSGGESYSFGGNANDGLRLEQPPRLESSIVGLLTANDVLNIDPASVADMLGLRQVLSQGRNDGLASMMRVIQDQIRTLLLFQEAYHDGDENGSTDTPKKNENPAGEINDKINIQPVANEETTSTSNNQYQRPPPPPSSSNSRTVAMLLSGGVDSSVALNLLKRQGYNVTAFYLKIWLEDELAYLGTCPWEEDFRICKEVCQQAGVPLESISLQQEYKETVISYTVHEAERGRTPNPDIMCNSRVKFGCFYDAIEERGFDFVASGHYAQLTTTAAIVRTTTNHLCDNNKGTPGIQRLLRAPDPVKDQSYFLCALTQEQLKRVLFPIGHLQKSEVRELAQEFDLPNKNRPDSQGLCFLGKVKFDEFLGAYLGKRPGNIIDAGTGDILGRHNGVWYHTVGQRKGLGKVLDPIATSRGPWYVVAKDPERDIVFVSNQYDEDIFTAARTDFFLEDIRWISGTPPLQFLQREEDNGDDGNDNNNSTTSFNCRGRIAMKIRHGPKIVEGSLEFHIDENGNSGDSGNVRLDNKDGGLAPGQFVAFYAIDDNDCLGSGIISERHWAKFLLQSEFVVAASNA